MEKNIQNENDIQQSTFTHTSENLSTNVQEQTDFSNSFNSQIIQNNNDSTQIKINTKENLNPISEQSYTHKGDIYNQLNQNKVIQPVQNQQVIIVDQPVLVPVNVPQKRKDRCCYCKPAHGNAYFNEAEEFCCFIVCCSYLLYCLPCIIHCLCHLCRLCCHK